MIFPTYQFTTNIQQIIKLRISMKSSHYQITIFIIFLLIFILSFFESHYCLEYTYLKRFQTQNLEKSNLYTCEGIQVDGQFQWVQRYCKSMVSLVRCLEPLQDIPKNDQKGYLVRKQESNCIKCTNEINFRLAELKKKIFHQLHIYKKASRKQTQKPPTLIFLLYNLMGNQSQTISYACSSNYIGEASNNLPHGKGVLHIHKDSPCFKSLSNKLCIDSNNCSTIEVFCQNGKIKKCKINFTNGLTYEGAVDENQLLNGQGKLIDQQKVVYEGTFQNGKLLRGKIQSSQASAQNQISYVCETKGQFMGTSIINGPSTFYNITQEYLASGDFHKGKISKGFYIFHNGDHYQGQFSQGVPHGTGTYKNGSFLTLTPTSQADPISSNQIALDFIKNIPNNLKKSLCFSYSGSFENGNPNGKGEINFSNGDSYRGRLKDGQIHGQGEYKFTDHTTYKGGFYCGSMNGDCIIQFNQKSPINANKKKHEILQRYEGQVTNGIFHGLGILYYGNGVIFKGYFMDGAKNGPGVLIFCQNKYKCLYVMNKLVGELKLIVDS